MARTKQTARKSTGGKAPRAAFNGALKQRSRRCFQQVMTAQQQVDNDRDADDFTKKTSFLNYENLISSFTFNAGPQEQSHEFDLRFSGAVTTPPVFFIAPPPAAPAAAPAVDAKPLEATKKRQKRQMRQRSKKADANATEAPQETPAVVAAATAATAAPAAPAEESVEKEVWLGMQIVSKYDGDGMRKHGRPPLSLVVVLDTSGSMDSRFSADDESGRTKIGMAKEALYAIIDHCRDGDQLGLVQFDTHGTVVQPLESVARIDRPYLKKTIGAMHAKGGTSLCSGYRPASKMLRDAATGAATGSDRLYRVLYLTDLDSTVDTARDEHDLLAATQDNAACGVYTTVVGLGMDFNQRLVERISKTPGSKYGSITSVDEFQQMMSSEFDHDVLPIAFDIRIELQSSDFFIARAYGSAELNGFNSGVDKSICLSSEFSSPKDEVGDTKGGIIVFKLQRLRAAPVVSATGDDDACVERVCISVRYRDRAGTQHQRTIEVPLYSRPRNYFSSKALRKAIVLIRYIDIHNEYVLDDRLDAAAKQSLHALQLHQRFAEQISAFLAYMLTELEDCGDRSLHSSNASFLDLLQQIVDIETDAVLEICEQAEKTEKADEKLPAASASSSSGAKKGGRGSKKRSINVSAGCSNSSGDGASMKTAIKEQVRCPICLGMLEDPVQLLCLHSYCRACLLHRGDDSAAPPPEVVACPTCSQPTPTAQVRANFVLKGIVDSLKKHATSDSASTTGGV